MATFWSSAGATATATNQTRDTMTINSKYVSIEKDDHETTLCFWEDKEKTKLTYFKAYSNEDAIKSDYKYWGSDLKTIDCI